MESDGTDQIRGDEVAGAVLCAVEPWPKSARSHWSSSIRRLRASLVQIKAWGGREEYGKLDAGIGKGHKQAEAVPSSIRQLESSMLLRRACLRKRKGGREQGRYRCTPYQLAKLRDHLKVTVRLWNGGASLMVAC